MGFREGDSVVALSDITCSITRRQVSSGDQGVIVKQSGWHPASFKIRFAPSGGDAAPVILDGITERQLARRGAPLGDPFEGQADRPGKPGTATDPWWTTRDPFAGSQA